MKLKFYLLKKNLKKYDIVIVQDFGHLIKKLQIILVRNQISYL